MPSSRQSRGDPLPEGDERLQSLSHALAEARASLAQALDESARLRALVAEHERMLKERDDLLWFVAHEVRQPLNNASAALQAATAALCQPDMQAPPQAHEPLARAGQVLQHVIGALNNNLAAATLLVEGAQATLVDTDLGALIDLVMHDIDSQQRHRIQVESFGMARTVQLQPGLARLALSNLLTNALRYSPEPTPVRLVVYDTDEPLALTFEVIDQGTGLPADLQQRLRDPGTRGSSARSETGAGLGLYLVHQVVRLHGGTVEVAALKPQGTCIRLTLPQGVAQ